MENGSSSFGESPRLSRRINTNTNWTTLLAGVAIGMVGLHLLSDHSLSKRLDGLESEFDRVCENLDDVAGARDDVQQANDLLAALTEQRSRLISAQSALKSVDLLAANVANSSKQAEDAETILARLIDLNNDLIATSRKNAELAAAIDNVRDLQSRVAGLGDDSRQAAKRLEEARVTLAGLEQLQQRVCDTKARLQQSRDTLDAVSSLQDELASTGASTGQARIAAEGLIALKDNLNAGGDQLESAEENAERLIVLKDDIAGQRERIPTAEQNAERLIDLQNRLVSDDRLHFIEAASNVERLIRIQAEIAARTDDLADSIAALEVLDDFQTEFNAQSDNVQEMRRQLTELILLQTTIEQALEAVKPISELGDLRRLDARELQEAARVILEQRRSRLARTAKSTDLAPAEPADASNADLESDESAFEIRSPEIERPVPIPPDDNY